MIQRRKVAYRHARSPHYHHRIPVTSENFKKRYHHKKYFTCSHAVKKMESAPAQQKHFRVLNPLKDVKERKENKGLFGTRKKDKKNSSSSSKNTGKKKKKHGKHYALKRFIVKMLIVAVIFYVVLTYVFGITILYGNYMYPSVRDGDLVISYKLQKSVTNDLILYRHDNELMVGRVVAKENAVIRFNAETETYSVNGVTPSESIFYTTLENPDSDIEYPYTVPPGCVYVLADHREDYLDSRTYEAIPESEIEGVVVFVIRRRGF